MHHYLNRPHACRDWLCVLARVVELHHGAPEESVVADAAGPLRVVLPMFLLAVAAEVCHLLRPYLQLPVAF